MSDGVLVAGRPSLAVRLRPLFRLLLLIAVGGFLPFLPAALRAAAPVLTPEVGRATLNSSVVVGFFGLAVSLLGVLRKDARLVETARRTIPVITGLTVVATLSLLAAFVTDDFSVSYVRENSERNQAEVYKLTSLWGGHAGSLLFWTVILSIFGALVVRRESRESPSAATPFLYLNLLVIQTFFSLMTAMDGRPFARELFTASDGVGLNPLLQDIGMAFHPPSLYLGYVGFAVPFCYSQAALLSGELDGDWIRKTRKWALLAWAFQGLGIMLGGQWAYRELGWGGYWAWDPVENVSFLPWLASTAYLHSVMVQEKRGMLKFWNVLLSLLTFSLAILGTYLTRSGVVESVHSFANSGIEIYFRWFLIGMLLAGLAVILWRTPMLRPENKIESVLSRESAFLFNNMIFMVLIAVILVGTFWPTITEAFTGKRAGIVRTVYDSLTGPLWIGLLFLMGVGPLIAWRKAGKANLVRNFTAPAALGAGAAIVLLVAGMRAFYPIAVYSLSVFVLATIVLEFVRGVRARRAHSDEGVLLAWLRLMMRNRRRYVGYLVHLGILFIACGIVSSSVFQTEREIPLGPGESAQVGPYTLAYRSLEEGQEPVYSRNTLRIDLKKGNELLTVMRPETRHYLKSGNRSETQTTEVSVLSEPLRDLYVALAGVDGEKAVVKVFLNPMIAWVWIGGAIVLLGALILLLPE